MQKKGAATRALKYWRWCGSLLDTGETICVDFCERAYRPEDTDPKREGHPDRAEITDSPAWQLANEDQRTGLKAAARRFLFSKSDHHRKKGTWTNWAGAAGLAISLMRNDLGADEELFKTVRTRWPRVVFDDRDYGSPVQQAVVAAVYRLVPEVATRCLAGMNNCAGECFGSEVRIQCG